MDWTGFDWAGLVSGNTCRTRVGGFSGCRHAADPVFGPSQASFLALKSEPTEVLSELTESCQSSRSVVRAHSVLSYNWTLGLFELTEYHQIVCDVHTRCMHVSMIIAMQYVLDTAECFLKAKNGQEPKQE